MPYDSEQDRIQDSPVDRRRFLAAAGLLGGAAVGGAMLGGGPALARGTGPAATGAGGPAGTPFALGVASGDPLPGGVVLWTRLVRDPLDGAAAGTGRPTAVEWQVAADPRFTRVVRAGTAVARPAYAHSVHVDVRGLQPGRDYYYRFRTGSEISPVGRTRTAPAAGSDPRVRFAIANCQDFQNGYWPAYDGLAAEDVDLVVHLGDYIYEYDPDSRFPDRRHTVSETPGLDQLRTLSDYRARHGQYKSDPALQAAHAAFPWVVTWDDHEVENNYAALVDEIDDTGAKRQSVAEFRRQRAAAYQAYYEHMPIRARYVAGTSRLDLYRRFDLGRTARISVLDTRQYRTDQPGGFPADFGLAGPGIANVGGTLTGAPQERWLTRGLTRSPARWNVIAQQVMMSRIIFPPAITNLDQWDGYVPQRTRLLRFLERAQVANPVVLAGDIHSSWFSDLKRDFDDPASPTVAVEFTATSISSDFPIAFDLPIKLANPVLNPHVKYFDGSKRGYLRCELTRGSWRTDVRVVDTIAVRQAPVRTAASFAVEAGVPGLVPA